MFNPERVLDQKCVDVHLQEYSYFSTDDVLAIQIVTYYV